MPSTRSPVGGRHIRLLDCVLSTLPEVWARDKNRILATTMESELFIILGVESLASIDRVWRVKRTRKNVSVCVCLCESEIQKNQRDGMNLQYSLTQFLNNVIEILEVSF